MDLLGGQEVLGIPGGQEFRSSGGRGGQEVVEVRRFLRFRTQEVPREERLCLGTRKVTATGCWR